MQAWSRQHQQRLGTALTDLLATLELLQNLLVWLQWAETNLDDKDKEALPQEIEEIKSLIAKHQVKISYDTFFNRDFYVKWALVITVVSQM